MNQMNQVVIEGNVVRDTTVRETARGTRVCIVPIATNHFYRNANGETQKEVAFFDVEAWGDNFCTRMAQMAKKGRGLRVVGRLKQDRWKNQEGKSASKIYILAEHIDFQHPKTEEKSAEEKKVEEEEQKKKKEEENKKSDIVEAGIKLLDNLFPEAGFNHLEKNAGYVPLFPAALPVPRRLQSSCPGKSAPDYGYALAYHRGYLPRSSKCGLHRRKRRGCLSKHRKTLYGFE